MTRPEMHTLSHRKRDESDRRNADCSCGHWHMRNATLTDIRESHAAHLQAYLGSEAQEQRMGASE